jgi:DNA-directed RNA polymerase beta subunit
MKHIHTFESFMNENTNEAYKQVPYNVKIAGKYEITINGEAVKTSIAGFERENDDSDSLYLMDEDPLKAEHGSFIVKNSDMPKLQKGTVVKAMCSNHGVPATLKRIGDL